MWLQYITGEVYSLDDDALARFDVLESYPGYYDRQNIGVTYLTDADGNDITTLRKQDVCLAYFLSDFLPKLLDLPYIENYDGKTQAVGEYLTVDKREKLSHPREHWWDVKHKPQEY